MVFFLQTSGFLGQFFYCLMLAVYKQVFGYLKFANHKTKDSFVSTTNKPLVGTSGRLSNDDDDDAEDEKTNLYFTS